LIAGVSSNFELRRMNVESKSFEAEAGCGDRDNSRFEPKRRRLEMVAQMPPLWG
jgi:hypothetical protein